MSNLSTQNRDELKYPIGRYRPPETITEADRNNWIAAIASHPSKVRDAVADLDEAQLATPYRDGGWTVRQVVHHLPDSHVNCYCRFRLALTEENPAIKAYREATWAELPDAKSAPIAPSLLVLEGLHERWMLLLRAMTEPQYGRSFEHSELGRVKLDWALGLYAWHGAHHVAQITALRSREGW